MREKLGINKSLERELIDIMQIILCRITAKEDWRKSTFILSFLEKHNLSCELSTCPCHELLNITHLITNNEDSDQYQGIHQSTKLSKDYAIQERNIEGKNNVNAWELEYESQSQKLCEFLELLLQNEIKKDGILGKVQLYLFMGYIQNEYLNRSFRAIYTIINASDSSPNTKEEFDIFLFR